MATLAPTTQPHPTSSGPRSITRTTEWPLDPDCFDPELDDEHDISYALHEFEKDQLSKSTGLYSLASSSNGSDAQESTLDEQQSVKLLSSAPSNSEFHLFSVSRNLKRDNQVILDDRRRLHITPAAFRSLMSSHNAPVSLMAALSRPYMVCGTGFRKLSDEISDYWCLLPVRVVVKCQVDAKEHTKSTAGSNQMDPFHYIHLSGAKADIRGSHIGIYVRRDVKVGSMSVIVVNLLDGRFKNLIEEPLVRTKAALARKRKSGAGGGMGSFWIHLIYMSSALRWWNSVLLCFNQQLVMHEKHLQNEIASETSAFSEGSKDINNALHIMAAHLHRYKSELGRLSFILSDLLYRRLDLDGDAVRKGDNSPSSVAVESEKEKIRIEQLQSQLKAITDFSDEMERKVQNILTLLFNQIQATNDKTLQAILRAAQTDAKISQEVALQSHQLTISMKNDSIAMKTIAILTMLFLPGTSFAAVLAMPFFDDNEYLGEPSKVWIWLVLTIASTIGAFWGFFHVTNRQEKISGGEKGLSSG